MIYTIERSQQIKKFMEEREMKQNNCRTKLKAIIAVVLVMASLFAMASLVSAGFIEEVFSEVCELMTTSSAGTGENGHSWRGNGTAGYCQDCH